MYSVGQVMGLLLCLVLYRLGKPLVSFTGASKPALVVNESALRAADLGSIPVFPVRLILSSRDLQIDTPVATL